MYNQGYANVPCDFHILKENTVSYSWNTIRVGKRYHLLDNSQVAEYATEYLVEHPGESNQFIVELAFCNNTMSIDDILDKVADFFEGKIEPESDLWDLEKRRLHFCVLTYLKNNVSDTCHLLDRIAQVYDDFDFPKDMKAFIYYMPAENSDSLLYSKEECMERLVRLFDDFLINEKKLLIAGK